jgi:acyl-CoA dehydrogenase
MTINDINQGEEIAQIRQSVRRLCEAFASEYWRRVDRERAYPSEFVDALSEAGYLSVLIPEEYGGSGLPLSAAAAILEEIQRAGANGGACHAQMYIMGALLRHGNEAQTRARSRPLRGATATTMSSTAKRYGPRVPSTPT